MGNMFQGNLIPDSTSNSKVLIVGDGLTASIAVAAVDSLGLDVVHAESGPKSSVLFGGFGDEDSSTDLNLRNRFEQKIGPSHCQTPHSLFSTENGFTAVFKDGSRAEYGAVILATEGELKSAPKDLPEGVILIRPGFPEIKMGTQVCFLLDYEEMTNPSIGKCTIRTAIENKETGGNSYVLLRHAPVRGLEGETLYEEARLCGVKFLRYGHLLPRFEGLPTMNESSFSFRVAVRDTVESGEDFVFEADSVFVGVNLALPKIPTGFKDLLSYEVDERGYLIQNSVHCLTGKSFRKGAYCLGPSTGCMDVAETVSVAKAVTLDAAAWLKSSAVTRCEEKMSVTEQCIRCMTCLRLCPHSAITIMAQPSKSRIKVSQTRCLECGICVAECPRTALDLIGFSEEEFSAFLERLRSDRSTEKIAIFGCHRSAGHAISEISLPGNVFFFPVSCAGRLSESILSSTLTAGVKGVLILGCHHGNCRSKNGTDLSKARIEAISNKLNKVFKGIPYISYKSMAANEASRMLKIVTDFANTITRTSE
ncbi:MAG: hydrogenase iron-sulfur subunit [Desulfomonilaceae bacterium]